MKATSVRSMAAVGTAAGTGRVESATPRGNAAGGVRKRFALACGAAALAGLFAGEASAAEPVAITFQKKVLDTVFRSEGVAVGDFNKDGKNDVAAGSLYYAAPDWAPTPILAKPDAFDPHNYSNTFTNFTEDLSGDGWDDLIVVDWPGKQTWWYENPQKAAGPWKRYEITPVTNNESPLYTDLLGTGKRELICGLDGNKMGFVARGDDNKAVWKAHPIAEKNQPDVQRYYHGLGVGDLNKDGRNDVLTPDGWFEAPEDRNTVWKFHPVKFFEACGHMYVYDFDGDGDNDVLSSSAHKIGIWWSEQTPDGWKRHEIDSSFSQTHSMCLADINGDGLMDFVTGKRWWAHGPKGDPGSDQPAVLYWFELRRENGKAAWTPHLIDNQSGVGVQFETVDVNGDKLLDVVVSNKRGVFYFEQARQ